MSSEDNREQQISKAWAGEADRADKLEALCRQLAEACDDGLAKMKAALSEAAKLGVNP